MSAPTDSYTEHLLGMAHEECAKHHLALTIYPPSHVEDGAYIEVYGPFGDHGIQTKTGDCYGTALADALCALLSDLGIEPPERPSEERVEDGYAFVVDVSGVAFMKDRIRDLYAREPLVVRALLEGGAS